MRKPVSIFTALLLVAAATPAAAGPLSVAVSARGANSAGCGGVASPCRTLQYAHNLVDPRGKIDVLDSADYGSIFIYKSVTIVYGGTGVAPVTPIAAGRNAIRIDAGATDVIRLTGLTIDGAGTGANGIHFAAGRRLEFANGAIGNFAGFGLVVTAANSSYSIVNSTIDSNGSFGVATTAPSGFIRGAADNLRLIGNAAGGMQVAANSGATNEAVVSDSVAMNQRNGPAFIVSGAGAQATLRGTTMIDNSVGVPVAGGGLRASAAAQSPVMRRRARNRAASSNRSRTTSFA
jgi:hypothetical protein